MNEKIELAREAAPPPLPEKIKASVSQNLHPQHLTIPLGSAITCFWDVETSGQVGSAAGTGRITAEMQAAATFLDAGWDFVGEVENGTHEVWQMPEGGGYPILAIMNGYAPAKLQGDGTLENPYLISDALELGAVVHHSSSAHYRLVASIDLSGIRWATSVIPTFAGSFDGNNLIISNLTISGSGYLGLFGQLGRWDAPAAKVKDLGLVDVNITGSGNYVGGLVGYNLYGSTVTRCYSTGVVTGSYHVNGPVGDVGGLVGSNMGKLTLCRSSSAVHGDRVVGGLVGDNYHRGIVTQCYSTGSVSGRYRIGGLVGNNYTEVAACFSTGAVSGEDEVGGLVGFNVGAGGTVANCYSTGRVGGGKRVGGLAGGNTGDLIHCYSAGAVSGEDEVGGLVGDKYRRTVTASFWDTQTSGQATSAGGTGKTTVEMQTASTFLEAGWDFVGETANGTEDIWWIDEGKDYPRLSWETKYGGGHGIPQHPYQIATAEDLILLGESPEDYDKHFILIADIDLDPSLPGRKVFDRAVIAPDIDGATLSFDGTPFTGVFAGNGHTISHLMVAGGGYLGLFGQVYLGAAVKDLGLVDVSITGSGVEVGGLVGDNSGSVTGCHSTGDVYGSASCVGGLAGTNHGTITWCYGTGRVYGGSSKVGGLAGENWGLVSNSYSGGTVSGDDDIGGLVGYNNADLMDCYSAVVVNGTGEHVGGLVGWNAGRIIRCFWDTTVSGLFNMCGGQTHGATGCDDRFGKTQGEMQTATTFLDGSWDFVDETANGTEDIWWILEGKDYPRLWWEAPTIDDR